MRLVFVQPSPYFYPWYPPNYAALIGWMSSRHPDWETAFHPMRPWPGDKLALLNRSKWEHPFHQGRLLAPLWSNGNEPSAKGAPVRFQEWIDREVEQIVNRDPDCVGICTSLGDWMYGFPLAARLRETMPAVRILGGGPHLTLLARLATRNGFQHLGAVLGQIFDALVEGEGEAALSSMVAAIGNGRSLAGLPGVYFPQNGGLVAPGKPPEPVTLSNLPAHRFDHFPPGLYTTPTLETSRGCVSDCVFCSVRQYWPGFRIKSAETLRREIDAYLEQFAERPAIRFVDTTLNPRAASVREMIRYLREVGSIPWSSFVRIQDLSEENLDLFAESGCQQLLFGIESGDEELLPKLGKKHTVTDAERVLGSCISRGILPVPSVIVGLPDETAQSVEKTLDLAERLGAEHGCSELIVEEFLPIPGSPYVEGGRIPVREFLSETPEPDAMPIGPHVWYRPRLNGWRRKTFRRARILVQRGFARRVDFFPTEDLGLR